MIKKLAEDYAAAKQGLRDYTKARAEGKHEPLRAGLAKHRQVIKGVERHIATLTPVDRATFDSHVSAAKSGKVLIQTPSPSAPVVAAPEVSRSHPLPVQRREKAAPKLTSTNYRNLVDAARPSGTHVKNLTVAEQRKFEAAGLIKPGDGHHVQITDAGRALLEAEKIPHYKPPAQAVAAPAKKFDEAAFVKATQYGHAPPTFLKDSARNHALGLSKQANSLTALAEQGHDKHISALHAHQDALEAHIDAKSPESDLEHHKVMIRKHKAAPDDSLRAEVQVHAQSAYKAEKQHAEAKSWDQKPHDPKAAAAADRASQMRSDAIRAGKTDFLGRPTDSFRKEWEAKNAPKAKRLVSAAKPAAHSVRVVNLQVPRARVIAGEAAMRLPYQVTAPRATPKAGMKAPASAIRIGKKGGRFILSASGQKHYV